MKQLSVNIDNELKFHEHISNICLKANRKLLKLGALTRLLRFFSFQKRRTLFIESQFRYCLLVWTFHRRKTTHKINSLHGLALKIDYKNYVSSFQDLLTIGAIIWISISNYIIQ